MLNNAEPRVDTYLLRAGLSLGASRGEDSERCSTSAYQTLDKGMRIGWESEWMELVAVNWWRRARAWSTDQHARTFSARLHHAGNGADRGLGTFC